MTRPQMLLAMLGLLLLCGGALVFESVFLRLDAPSPPAEMQADEDDASPAGHSASLTSSAASSEEDAAAKPRSAAEETEAPGRSIAATTLHGNVVDASGRAVKRGSFVLCNDQGVVRIAHLEPGGAEYEIVKVTPGSWTAAVIADGYATRSSTIELDGVSARVRHDVVLKQGSLDVRLETPQGRRLRDVIRENLPSKTIEVRVIATKDLPGAALPSLTPGDGSLLVGQYRRRFSHPDRGIDGTMRLAGLPPVYVSAVFQQAVLATAHVPHPTREVVLIVPLARVRAELASLRALFVDADTARPVRGAAAVLTDAERLARSTVGGFSGRDGSLVLADQPPGRWTLEVVTRGYERFRRTVQLSRGHALDLGPVRLSRSVSVAGRTVDAAGKPVRASVACYPTSRPELRAVEPRFYRTRYDGSFRILDIGRGFYVLIAQASGYAPAKRYVETRNGKVDGLDVVLERGVPVTIDHRIQESNRYRFEVTDLDGWILSSHEVRSFAWPWRVRLAAGSYTLRVLDRGRLHKTLPIVVGAKPVKWSLKVE